jgi:hypothetical protein
LVRHPDQTAQGRRKMLIGQANAHHLNIRVLFSGQDNRSLPFRRHKGMRP